MKKQYALPILFFTLGIAITIIGALFKIMHWPGANLIISFGLFLEIIFGAAIMIYLLKNKNK